MKKLDIHTNHSTLHILAMTIMFIDHSYHLIFTHLDWMNRIGRIAFPIFAFLIVEGYIHTHDVKSYIKRLLIFAILSEIPFNLMVSGSILFPFYQNVIFTLLIAIIFIQALDRLSEKIPSWLAYVIISYIGYYVGQMLMTDYAGAGVLTVLLFYITKNKRTEDKIIQTFGLIYINQFILGGHYISVEIFGYTLELHRQLFAVLAMIPIWLYNGEKGINSKKFQYLCYGFYPLHLILLYIISRIIYTVV